jgi:restriction endonuclease
MTPTTKIKSLLLVVEAQSNESAKEMRQPEARRLTEASSSLSAVAKEWTVASLARPLHDNSVRVREQAAAVLMFQEAKGKKVEADRR